MGRLGRHEALCRDKATDLDILSEPTDGDLDKPNVPLGRRKRLIWGLREAVARFDDDDIPLEMSQAHRLIAEFVAS